MLAKGNLLILLIGSVTLLALNLHSMFWKHALRLVVEVLQAFLKVSYQTQWEIYLKISNLITEDSRAQDQKVKDLKELPQKIIIDLR